MKDGLVKYERIIATENLSKAEIYDRCKIWALSSFNSQKDALQLDDKEAGIIAYKTNKSYAYQIEVNKFVFDEKYTLDFLIKFFVKDGKFKIIVQDLILSEYIKTEIVTRPIEEVAYLYEHQDSIMNSVKLPKKVIEQSKQSAIKQKAIFSSLLRNCNSDILNILGIIQDKIIGKSKSDADF